MGAGVAQQAWVVVAAQQPCNQNNHPHPTKAHCRRPSLVTMHQLVKSYEQSRTEQQELPVAGQRS